MNLSSEHKMQIWLCDEAKKLDAELKLTDFSFEDWLWHICEVYKKEDLGE